MSLSVHDLELIGLFLLSFVQEDSAVFTAAMLGYHHTFPYGETLVACLAGIWVSDFLIYLLGRLGGMGLFNIRWMRHLVSPEKVERASGWFNRFGWTTLVFSRLVPGSRTALLFSSGLLKYHPLKFLAVSFGAALSWLCLVFSLFAHFGLPAAAFLGSRWMITVTLLMAGGVASLIVAGRKMKRGRRKADEAGSADSAPEVTQSSSATSSR